MTFPVVGVHVELARSNDREVWLKTNKRSSGQYKCQVSIEGTFNSISAEKRMEVVDGNQFGSAQASSGYVAGASLWQQPQQYDIPTTNRQQQQHQGSLSIATSSRAQSAGQRHGAQASSSGSYSCSGRVGVGCNNSLLVWPALILVSLLVQILATQRVIAGLGQRGTGYKLDPHREPS